MGKEKTKTAKKTATMPLVNIGFINNTKIANQMSDARYPILVNGKETNFEVIPEIYTSLKLSLDDDNLVLSSNNITGYDMAVMDAVCTLYEHGCTIFTAAMLLRMMTGKDSGQTVNEKSAKDITDSLNKLMRIVATVDMSREYIERNLVPPNSTVKKQGHLLQMNCIQVTIPYHKGVFYGYELLDEPILYTYAKEVQQVLCYPVKLLEVDKFNTKETILIKRYLLVRIETMKNARNNVSAKKILYDRIDRKTGEKTGMFAYLGFSEENYSNWRKKRGAIHNTVCSILDAFIENTYILNYRILKGEKGKTDGVEIIL